MAWLSECALVAAIGCALSGSLLVVLDDRRLLLAVLAAQCALSSWLVAQAVPLTVAAGKLAAGWMACGVLALTVHASLGVERPADGSQLPTGGAFRVAAVLLILAVGVGLGRGAWPLVPGLSTTSRLGTAFLTTLGLLHIGITEDPLRVGLGLLTLLSGFEVLYSVLEPSLAVTALLAAVHLGTAIVVSYLLLVVPASARREGL
ncbi:MAG: hypothetical protein AB1449_04435 [Chloroflexota bacterium]